MSRRLPAIKPAALIRVLQRLGFEIDRQRGSHAIFLRASDGRRAVVPMHGRDLKAGTLHGILCDIGLSSEDLRNLL